MKRNINFEISNLENFFSDLEKKNFAEIQGSEIWDLGYEIEPYHKYIKPPNFPNCCEYHKDIMSNLKEWFDSFPYCCINHKKLINKNWFKKDLYNNIPDKTILATSYSSSFIRNNIDNENWYKVITDYIDYVIESFGTPNIGGDRYFKILRDWIKTDLQIQKEYEWKRNQLLDFFEAKTQTKNNKETNINLLNSTFQDWIKYLPEISIFNSLKVIYKGKLPLNLFLYDGEVNKFTGLTNYKSRTQSELIEILVNHTRKILTQLTSENIYKSLNITEKEKYEIQIIAEKHKIEQLLLLENFSNNELKYITILKKWLKNEKKFINDLKPILEKATEQNFHSFLIEQIFLIGQSLEKQKHLHNLFGEEDFRDYFLPYLTHLSKKHIATGETFNKKGKTDILIQDLNAINTFIAECKLWKGKSHLTSAINQLLERYVLWRDEKVAIMIFNKDNKNFGNVIEIAKETMEEHELFESFIEEKYKTVITYRFKHSEDQTKFVTVELILFNCFQQ